MTELVFWGAVFSPLEPMAGSFQRSGYRFTFITEGELDRLPEELGPQTVLITSLRDIEALSGAQQDAFFAVAKKQFAWFLLTPRSLTLAEKHQYNILGVTELIERETDTQSQLIALMSQMLIWFKSSQPSALFCGHFSVESQQSFLLSSWERNYYPNLDQLHQNLTQLSHDCVVISDGESAEDQALLARYIEQTRSTALPTLLFSYNSEGYQLLNAPANLRYKTTLNTEEMIAFIEGYRFCRRIVTSLYCHQDDADARCRQVNRSLDQHAIVSAANRAGRITYVNDAFCEISGFERSELLGRTHSVVKSGIHDGQFYQQMWSTITSGEAWHGEVCNRKKDGSLYWVEATIVPFVDAQGEIYEYFSIRTDITKLKERESQIRRHDELLRHSHEVANIGTWRWNIKTGDLYWSERIAPLFGYKQGELETSYENFIAAVHPDDQEKVQQAVESSVSGGGPYEIEHRVVWPDGSIKWVLEKGAVDYDEAGQPHHMLGVVLDVNDRKVAELELAATQQRFTFAVEGAGDGVWDWNLISGQMTCSGLYMAMLGYENSETVRDVKFWMDSVHPDDFKLVDPVMIDYLEGRIPNFSSQFRFRCLDGSYKWMLCRGTVVERDPEGRPTRMIGIQSDITEQKEAETNLRLFRQVFNASEQCMAVADKKGDIIFINQAYSHVMGYDYDEVVGHNFREFIAKKDTVAEQIADTLVNGKKNWNGLTKRRRKDGSTFIATNSFGTVKDSDGNVLYIFVIFYDFSQELERREELSRAKDQAEQASRAKSEFLSRMSHELRTPMNAVIGFAQLLEYDEQITEDQLDNVNEIIKAGRHLLELINEVLDLAKIESGRIEVSIESVNLDLLLSECQLLVKPLLIAADISLSMENITGSVLADQVRLKQVFINLITNAIKYNRPGGRVEVRAMTVDERLLKIEVEDTGIGISEDSMAQLFEPFNRLGFDESDIEGTGIGLTITRRLVELMDGTINAVSEPDKGTIFTVELPLSLCEAPLITRKQQSALTNGDAALLREFKVLCVDDNPVNLKLMEQVLLQRDDIQLLSASSPEQGIEYALGNNPDLILLDINMPRMSGYDVLQVLRQRTEFQQTPVIAITANAMPEDIKRGKAAGFAEYLTKPLDIKHTLDVLEAYLPAVIEE